MAETQTFDERPDPERRKLLVRATGAVGGAALAAASYPFLVSLAPSERAKSAGAPVEVDTARLAPGQLRTLEWRGKPIWVLRRTPEMLAGLKTAESMLSDPGSEVTSQQPEYARNRGRSINEGVFVTVALCTHLGCIPSYYREPDSIQPGWPGGFYCPCHGSKFDLAGRVYKGSPAPTNLVIPPHRYEGSTRLVVGIDASGEA